MAGGRPTKYKPEYCDVVRDFIGEQGKSIAQLSRELRVAKSTIYEWVKQYDEFSNALKESVDWAEAYWEDKYTVYMEGGSSNPTLIKLYFANRFQWYDKPEAESQEAGNTTTVIIKKDD